MTEMQYFKGKILLILMIILLPFQSLADEGEIIISAASSLTNVLKIVKNSYQKDNKSVKIYLNFGGSGYLFQQIVHGAPVDLFIPADQIWISKAKELKLIDEKSLKKLVSNQLVLVSNQSQNLNIREITELDNENIKKIALSNPDLVPSGKYAKEILVKQKIWKKINHKLIQTHNVRQVVNYVVRGEVDFGFVYLSDTFGHDENIKIDLHLQSQSKIIYPGVITKTSKNKDLALSFLNFLLKEESQKEFKKNGFIIE